MAHLIAHFRSHTHADCCDGSDEPRAPCKNVCKAESEAQLAAMQRELTVVEAGVKARKVYVRESKFAKASWEERVKELEGLIKRQQKKVDAAQGERGCARTYLFYLFFLGACRGREKVQS
jgi:hypothetical protein